MFYSEKTFMDFATTANLRGTFCGDFSVIENLREMRAPKKAYRDLFREVKRGIVARESRITFTYNGAPWNTYIGKWFRPWDLVPELKQFRPPTGDYGIGIEVEAGFRRLVDAQFIIRKIANWKHITVDYEGNGFPAEVTFPPTLYSKFGPGSQACRYLKLLAANSRCVLPHNPNDWVGTHVNVSTGHGTITSARVTAVRQWLETIPSSLRVKYFGRGNPYGYLYHNVENNNPRIEYKMFDTVFDWRILRRYVDIAVKLTDLVCDTVPVTYDAVIQALEAGYNKHPIMENNNAA